MKIAFVGQPEYFRFCYEQDLSNDHIVREFTFKFGDHESSLANLLKFEPDATIFFRGEFIESSILNKLSCIKIAISSEPFPRNLNGRIEYTLDSLKRYLDFRSRIRSLPYDYVFHYDGSSIEHMAKDGLLLSGSFNFPVATDTYLPSIDTPPTRDIFFIGRSTNHRERFLGPLKHHFNFLHICHGIYGEELLRYIQSARINLNVHAENEVSWEPRMQMLLATGAFVISEPLTPNNILRPGIDYIEAKTPSDMYELTNYYLTHEEERIAIAKSGRSRVEELLSARKNFSKLLFDIQRGIYPKYEARSSSKLVDLIAFIVKTISRMRIYY